MNICAELRPRIVAFLDGELTDAEAATVASHLEACDECRAERQVIVATRELLGEIPAPAPAPDAWKRLRREIRPAPRVSRIHQSYSRSSSGSASLSRCSAAASYASHAPLGVALGAPPEALPEGLLEELPDELLEGLPDGSPTRAATIWVSIGGWERSR